AGAAHRAHVAVAAHHDDVAHPHREGVVDPLTLRDVGDQAGLAGLGGGAPVQQHPAGARPDPPDERGEQGGFAASVGAEQAAGADGADGEDDDLQGEVVAVAAGGAGGVDGGGGAAAGAGGGGGGGGGHRSSSPVRPAAMVSASWRSRSR